MVMRTAVLALADEYGIDVDQAVIDPPRARRTIDQTALPVHVDLVGGMIEIGGLVAPVDDAVRVLRGSRFNVQRDRWQVPPYQVRAVRTLAEQHAWVTSASFDGLDDADPADHPVTIHVDQGNLVVSFEYEPNLARVMARLPGASWDDRVTGWVVPVESGDRLIRAINKLPHTSVTAQAAELLDQTHTMIDRIDQSRALDGDLDIDGLALDLRPFQKGGVQYASEVRRCFIGDDMGLGKTPQGLATIQHTGSFPAVVICPSAVKVNWMIECAKWTPHLRVGALYGIPSNKLSARLADWITSGRSPFNDDVVRHFPVQPGKRIKIRLDAERDLVDAFRLITQLDVIVLNYDIIGPTEPTPTEVANGRTLEHGWTPVLKALPLRAAVGDELHLIKTMTALRTRAAVEVAESVHPEGIRVGMSGSLVLNHRSEIAAQLAFIGRLQEFGGAKAVARSTNLAERLRARCMVRRRKKEVLPELPPREHAQVVLGREALDASIMRKYDRAERDLLDFLAAEARRIAIEIGADPHSAAVSAVMRAAGAQYLIRVNVLRKLAMQAKLAAAEAWIRDFLESGEKLLVFADHLEPLDRFAAQFDAPIIKGSVSPERRQRIVDEFQQDDGPHVVFLQIKAGGVGLTMTAASNVLFIEQAWSPLIHDQAIDRCYGRLNDLHGAVGWYLLAERTIDEWIRELLELKRIECEDALDGDMNDGDIEEMSVYAALIERLVVHGLEPAVAA